MAAEQGVDWRNERIVELDAEAIEQKLQGMRSPSKRDERRSFINNGQLAQTLQFMRRYPTNLKIQLEGMRLFVSLAEENDNRNLISIHRIYEDIIAALHQFSNDQSGEAEQLIGSCFTTLRILGKNDATQKTICKEPHCAHLAVAKALRPHVNNPSLVIEGASALSTLAVKGSDLKALVDEHAHSTLLECLRLHPDNDVLIAKVLGALYALTWNPTIRENLKEAGAIEIANTAQARHPEDPQVGFYAEQLVDALK